MDIATLGGIVVCFILVIFGIVFDKGNLVFTNLKSFIDIPSVIITIGGTFACLFTMSGGIGDFLGKIKSSNGKDTDMFRGRRDS